MYVNMCKYKHMEGADRALLSRFWVQDLVRVAGYGPLSIGDTIRTLGRDTIVQCVHVHVGVPRGGNWGDGEREGERDNFINNQEVTDGR
jgi:hypothetical protein